MTYVGIDCGVNGAVAFLDERGNVAVMDTPTVKAAKGQEYLIGSMVGMLRGWVSGNDVLVAIEKLNPIPRQSSNTTAKQHYGIGLWEGIVAALGYRYEMVRPQRWKADIGLVKGAEKGESRAMAQRLFPGQAELFARVKDDGRAEAALMAEWMRRRVVRGEVE